MKREDRATISVSKKTHADFEEYRAKLSAAAQSSYGSANAAVLFGEGKIAVSYTHLTLPTNREV